MNHDTSPYALNLGVPKGVRSSSSALRRLERAGRIARGKRPSHVPNRTRKERWMILRSQRAAKETAKSLMNTFASRFKAMLLRKTQAR